MKIVLKISFLAFSNKNDGVTKLERVIWRFYITFETLLRTNWIVLNSRREFTKTVLDDNFKTFIIYMIVLERWMYVYLLRAA